METLEFINIICPEHDRTSCSDENISNGFYTRGNKWYGRCTRCMYLQIINGEELPKDFNHEECAG